MESKDFHLPDDVELLLQDRNLRRGFEESVMVADICRALAETRKAAGISQKELASQSGIDQAEISRIEAGTQSRGPTLFTLARLANAMDMRLHVQFVSRVQGEVLEKAHTSARGRARA